MKISFLPFVFLFSFYAINAQNKAAELDNLMNQAHVNGVFNGSVLVAENGKVIYRKAFGYANKEKEQQLTPEFSFDLASVSKQFTAMGIMILKERKQLSYEDKITKFFPDFPAYGKEVTVKNLLNNVSGIPKYEPLASKFNLSNAEILEIIESQSALDSEIGAKFVYNNGGYVMLALIIERVSGLSLANFLKENIFKPLKMKNTLVGDSEVLNIKNRAIGYTAIGERDDYQVSHTGSTSMFSTVDDLFLWDQALYTEKLVSRNTIAEAFTPVILNDSSNSNYGFGWFLTPEKHAVNHSGSDFGYRTFIFRDLAKNNTFIWLTNGGNAMLKEEINVAIENILASKPYKSPKITLVSVLQMELLTKTVDNAINSVNASIQLNPRDYALNDEHVNELGYNYLKENKVAEAFSIFKFNALHNPNSANVYDSLGEVYLLQKDSVNAIKNYTRSVSLNPDNANAVRALKKLNVDTAELLSEVTVSPDVLKTYVGRYQLNENYSFTVTEDKGVLHIQGTGERLTTVIPMSENKFYSKLVTAQFTFNKNKKGTVDSLTLNMGRDVTAKKVE